MNQVFRRPLNAPSKVMFDFNKHTLLAIVLMCVAALTAGPANAQVQSDPNSIPDLATHSGGGINGPEFEPVSAKLQQSFISNGWWLTGDTITDTAYLGAYAVRNRGNARPRYIFFRDNFSQLFINLGGTGSGVGVINGETPATARQKARSSMVSQIPIDKFIRIKNKTGYVAVVYTAPDCPYCIAMENELKRKGISYIVAPTWLSPANQVFVKKAYCSDDPAAAWNLMMSRQPNTRTTKPNCAFPQIDIQDFAFLFYGGSSAAVGTPQIVFKDGVTAMGWDSAKYMPLFAERVAKKVFFD